MKITIKTFTAFVLAAALLPYASAYATDKWVTGYYAGWHWNKFDYQAPDYGDECLKERCERCRSE